MIALVAVFVLVAALVAAWAWCGRRRARWRACLEAAVGECFAGQDWRGRVALRVRPRLVRSGGDVRLVVVAWTAHEVAEALGRVTGRLPGDVRVTVDATVGFDAPRAARVIAWGTRGAGSRRQAPPPVALAAPHRNGTRRAAPGLMSRH